MLLSPSKNCSLHTVEFSVSRDKKTCNFSTVALKLSQFSHVTCGRGKSDQQLSRRTNIFAKRNFDSRLFVNSSSQASSDTQGDDADKQAAEMLEHFNAFIRGRDEVNKMLERMSHLLEEFVDQGKSEEEAIFLSAATSVQENLEILDRSFLMALDVEINNSAEDKESQKILVVLKDQVLLQLTATFPPYVRVVSILSSTAKKNHRKEILCQAIAGGGVFQTVSGGTLEVPASDISSIVRHADDLVQSMEDNSTNVDRKLLFRLVLAREEARSLLSGGVFDDRNDTRKFRNVPQSHVDLMSELMQLSGDRLTYRLTRTLSGVDDASAAGKKSEAGVAKEAPVYPGGFLDSLTRINKQMYSADTAKGAGQLQWIRHQVLLILQAIAYPKEES